MLGSTAGGLYWTFRYLERVENTSRLLEAGLRLALTRATDSDIDWDSVLTTAGSKEAYFQHHDTITSAAAIDFVLRNEDNPASVASLLRDGRASARRVRAALTREVWEAVNECYLSTALSLRTPVDRSDLPRILLQLRQETALVNGSLHGTMLRNETFNFARIGTHLERADNTARILDVKYYVLLPSASFVGSALDNLQWATILRSVSAERAYRWTHSDAATPAGIAEFLILDRRLPRSLAFCFQEANRNLSVLQGSHGPVQSCHAGNRLISDYIDRSIDSIFDQGLHEFLQSCISDVASLGRQIEADFRFNA